MKLYLSSFHLGKDPQKLKNLVSNNKRAAVINNALDCYGNTDRVRKSKQQELDDLKGLGLSPEDLDLRRFFGKQEELRTKISEYGLVWVRGGSSFVLRRAMKESGFDEVLEGLSFGDSLVYAGYSFGVCVITPTLRGVELVDDPNVIPEGYRKEIIWDGVGLVNYSFAPHYHSNHPESEAVDKLVQYYIENNMPFRALRDGDVIVGSADRFYEGK